RRREPQPFTDTQIALLQTFADQAVIAIENVRLFTELQARNAELAESLEQQTATAEILRVISSSPTDLQPVMDAVVENAARVGGATDSGIWLLEGEHLRPVARRGSMRRAVAIGDSISVSRGTVAGQAVRDRRTIHVEDVQAAEAEFPESVSRIRQRGSAVRTMLVTPLLRQGTPLAVIFIIRPEVHPFSAKQIALLETFANQAVIAIENVRLFQELEARNRDLVATSEILQVISRSPTDAQPVFETIIRSAVVLCEAVRGSFYHFDGRLLHHVAWHGMTPEALEAARRYFPRPPSRGSVTGRAILTRTVVHIDITKDPEYELGGVVEAGFRTLLGVPMLRDAEPVGTIVISRAEDRPFSDRQIALLQTFADQAVIAVENVRLFTELETRNRELTESLEQQTATGEILRVISSSPTDVQPVFDTIVHRAVQLCGGRFGAVHMIVGRGQMDLAAHANLSPEALVAFRRANPRPGDRSSPSGPALLDRGAVHVPDIEAFGPAVVESARAAGIGSQVAVPMLREGVPIGTIAVARREKGPFSEKQIALLRTFADQAVIAIENVRLFTELQEKN